MNKAKIRFEKRRDRYVIGIALPSGNEIVKDITEQISAEINEQVSAKIRQPQEMEKELLDAVFDLLDRLEKISDQVGSQMPGNIGPPYNALYHYRKKFLPEAIIDPEATLPECSIAELNNEYRKNWANK